jgi:hypothetical protein
VIGLGEAGDGGVEGPWRVCDHWKVVRAGERLPAKARSGEGGRPRKKKLKR